MQPVNILMSYFLVHFPFYDINNNSIIVLLVFFVDIFFLSIFFSSSMCINKHFLQENCSWQSKDLTILSNFTFKTFKVLFSSANSRYFSLLSTWKSSSFLLINFITWFNFFSCWVHLIWASFVLVETRCIPLTFSSKFFRHTYDIDGHIVKLILSEKILGLSWFSDKSNLPSLVFLVHLHHSIYYWGLFTDSQYNSWVCSSCLFVITVVL